MVFAKVIPLRRAAVDKQESAIDLALQAQINAAIGGDTQAAQALLLRVLPRVRNLIRYLVRGEELDDLTQDALLRVLERLSSYRGEGRFEAWVDGVVVRVTLRNLSKRRIDQSRFQAALSDEFVSQQSSRPWSTRYLARRRAVEALDRLPAVQRITLVMHHVLGMTVTEIASEVGAPSETVRSRLRNGMAQMRALLGLLREES